ncbi:MAG: ABC transporter ATP-binding protein [Nitrospirota bacterium]
MIRLENVEKSYGGHKVLKGITLEVHKGEFISVMGSSGSGKSTLLNLIGGMDRPDGGRIFVHDSEISRFGDDALTLYRRQRVGFIFQFFNLLPNITVFENIAMPLLLNGNEDRERVSDYIVRTGLAGKEDKYPFQLSGGEQQRVAIARALVHDPAVILADEPTGSLDSDTGRMVMGLIMQCIKSSDKTVILVTHESYIAEYAGRIVKIRDGALME